LREVELSEYNNLKIRFQSGEDYRFEEFLEMIDWMRKPFVTEVEGHEVSLTQNDCTIMMESSAVQKIMDLLFLRKVHALDKTLQNKQQRTNTATV